MNASLSIISTELSLSEYMRQIGQYKMLSSEEEYSLARKVIDDQDINAAHTLVTSHLKLVVKIALQMKGYGLSLMDMIAEGNIGLMYAVKKFNPELGNRLSTYAMWWIKAAMQEFVIKSWSLVKIGTTVAQKKLFFNLNKIKRKIQSFHERSNDVSLTQDQINSISTELQVSTQDVKEMDQRLNHSDLSLDHEYGNSDSESSNSMLDFLPDTQDGHESIIANAQELQYKKEILANAMSTLNERERDIISARHLAEEADTLDVLSQKYSISRERIRQIESKAMEKLQTYCRANAPTQLPYI